MGNEFARKLGRGGQGDSRPDDPGGSTFAGIPLANPGDIMQGMEGLETHMSDAGEGMFKQAPVAPMGTLEKFARDRAKKASGGPPVPSGGGFESGGAPDRRRGLSGTSAGDNGGYATSRVNEPKPMTPAELMKLADEMLERQGVSNQAQLGAGPSVTGNGTTRPSWLDDYMNNEDSDLGF